MTRPFSGDSGHTCHDSAMSDEEEPSVLGALPHSRPHRRSAKREMRPVGANTAAMKSAGSVPAASKTAGTKTPANKTAATKSAGNVSAASKPAAAAVPPSTPRPPLGDSEESSPGGAGETDCMGAAELLTTVVQATAELAEIGLTAGARALRIAVSRLPRP